MLSHQSDLKIKEFIEAAEGLQTSELERVAHYLLQMHAKRKAGILPQRELELLNGIAQTSSYDKQTRFHQLNSDSSARALTENELNELHELISLSESLSVQRLGMLVELSQLRGVTIAALMKQLQIKAPNNV